MRILQHSFLEVLLNKVNRPKIKLSTLLTIIIICATCGILKNFLYNLSLQYKLCQSSIMSSKVNTSCVINRLLKEKEISYIKDFFKPSTNLEAYLGKSFADSLDYLHKLKGINLDWTSATPIFSPPFGVRKAGAHSFLYDHLNHYSPDNGNAQLRQAIIERFKRDGINASNDNILVHTSIFEILECIYSSLNLFRINTILIPTPNFGYYASQALNHGLIVKFISTSKESNWKINPIELDNVLTKTRSKIFLFNNPVNPTGAIYTKEELTDLAKVLKKHRVLVIADEIFKDIILDSSEQPFSIGAVDGMADLTITMNGVGKSMGLAGLRVSYAYVPDLVVEKIRKPLCGMSKPAEQAAIQALQNNHENHLYLQSAINEYKKRVKLIKNFITLIDQDLSKKFASKFPQDGFFAKLYSSPNSTNVVLLQFAGLRGKFNGNKQINSSLDLANYISKDGKIALVPGEASFIEGKEMVVRIPLSARNLESGLRAIRKVLLKLSN